MKNVVCISCLLMISFLLNPSGSQAQGINKIFGDSDTHSAMDVHRFGENFSGMMNIISTNRKTVLFVADRDFNILHQLFISGNTDQQPTRAIADSNYFYWIPRLAWDSVSTPSFGPALGLVKMDFQGNVIYSKAIGAPAGAIDLAFGSDGNLLVLVEDGTNHIQLFNIDVNTGIPLWSYFFSGSPEKMMVSSTGSIYLLGNLSASLRYNEIIKFYSDGTYAFTKWFDGNVQHGDFTSMKFVRDDEIRICANTAGTGIGTVILTMDTLGIIHHQHEFDFIAFVEGMELNKNKTSLVVLAGFTDTNLVYRKVICEIDTGYTHIIAHAYYDGNYFSGATGQGPFTFSNDTCVYYFGQATDFTQSFSGLQMVRINTDSVNCIEHPDLSVIIGPVNAYSPVLVSDNPTLLNNNVLIWQNLLFSATPANLGFYDICANALNTIESPIQNNLNILKEGDHLFISTGFDADAWCRIFDSYGKLIYYKRFRNNFSVDVSSFTTGVYIVSVVSGNSVLNKKLFID